MPNLLEWLLIAFNAVKSLVEKLQDMPVVWQALLNGQPVTLTGIAMKLDKPRSRYRVKFTDAAGEEHVIEALHDFDGKPADTLIIDGAEVPGGDMDIMIKPFKGELWLQFEWGANRLRLITDLEESVAGQVIEELIE
jgi:hypothetical protein